TKHCCILIGRRIKRGRRMRLMMLSKQHRGRLLQRLDFIQFLKQKLLEEELFFHPNRHGHKKGPKAPRRKRRVCLKQPLELQQRFIIEDDVVQVRELRASFTQAISYGVHWKTWIVLFPRETFLLRCSHNFSITNKTGGAVVIERGNTQNIHFKSP